MTDERDKADLAEALYLLVDLADALPCQGISWCDTHQRDRPVWPENEPCPVGQAAQLLIRRGIWTEPHRHTRRRR